MVMLLPLLSIVPPLAYTFAHAQAGEERAGLRCRLPVRSPPLKFSIPMPGTEA